MKRMVSILISVAFGLFGGVSAVSPASAAPAAGVDWTVIRGPQPGGTSVLVQDGEMGFADFTVTLGPGRAGWGKASKKKWVFSSSWIDVDGADSLDGWYSLYSYWVGTSSTDADCYDAEYFSTKFTVKAASCVDTVELVTSVVMDVAATVDTVLDATTETATIKANKTVIPVGSNRSHTASFRYDVENDETLTIDTAKADFVEPHVHVCVDESRADRGDSALISLAAELDGDPLPEVDSSPNPWVEWGASYWNDSSGTDGGEFLVDSEDTLFENVIGDFSGTIELPPSGVVDLTATADLKIGGTSILEACPVEGEGYSDPLDVSASNSWVNATATTRSLPDDMSWDSYKGQQGYLADGFGGIFTYNSDSESGNATVTHFDATGPQNSLGGSGSLGLPLQYWGDLSGSRWGAGGTSFLSVSVPDGVNWEVTTRSMNSSDRDDVTLTQRSLDAGCGVAGARASSIAPLSAPVDLPLVTVNCSKKLTKKKYASFVALATIDFSANNSIDFLVNPTPHVGAVLTTDYLQFAVQPRGSGTTDVLWLYTENINSKAKKHTVVNRAVTTVTGDGVASQTILTTDPFPGENPESLVLSPGASTGEWMGIGQWSGWDPISDDVFIDRKVVTVSGNSAITVGRSVEFLMPDGTDFPMVTALRPKTSTEVLLGLSGASLFDGELTTYYRAIVLQTGSGGTVRLGELVSNTQSSEFATPGVPPIGQNSDGDMVVYWITSETEYQVVTWAVP